MRGHGFSGAEVNGFSPAQLLWNLRQLRRRAAARDQRWLMLMAASQGDGAQKVWRQLAEEHRALAADSESPEAEEADDRATPRCQADFERMLRESEE